jgi:DNA-binding GntR family transcriptional regulator
LCAHLKPGEKILIAPLGERLGVSLSAVCEALSRLTAEGLVEAQDQRGFRVAPVSLDDLQDLTRTGIQIEGLALRLSMERGDAEWEAGILAAFHQLLRAAERSEPADRLSELHATFHHALVAASGSRWLMRFRNLMFEQSERYRWLSMVQRSPATRDSMGEHHALMDAAIERDTAKALRLLADHFNTTTRILIEGEPGGSHRGADGSAKRPRCSSKRFTAA